MQNLRKERRRVRNTRGDFVDTSLWQEGVLQRVKKKQLRVYLKKEVCYLAALLPF